jgi:F-box-like
MIKLVSFTVKYCDADSNTLSRKNRVPTKRELVSLRAIAESQAALSTTLENELSKMKITRSEIRVRYEAQMLLLETIQSELHQTEDFIYILESQKRNLEEEMEEYRGLLHPIRRYPLEILKLIFEMTLLPPGNCVFFKDSRHLGATRLSHVCQDWRSVALSTPSLWTEIRISFRISLRNIETGWNLLAERVKGSPATVFVNDIRHTPPGRFPANDVVVHREILGLRLKKISIISKLVLSTQCGVPSNAALALLASFQIGRLDCLEITDTGPHSHDPLNLDWSWFNFLYQLPPLTRLELAGLSKYPQNLLASPLAFPTVTELKLANMQDFPLVDVVRLFPNLLGLEIINLTGLSPSLDNGECVHPHLLSLMVQDVDSFPWVGSFKFSSLYSLHIEDDHEGPRDVGIVAFLAECSTLRKLNIQICNPLLAGLVSAAPQLHELILCVENDNGGSNLDQGWLTGTEFPLLRRLELQQSRQSSLSLANFELLVERRCLPASHTASLIDANLEPLQMLVIKSVYSVEQTKWIESRYLRQATFHQVAHHPYEDHETSINWL